jgi:hypothetical protein
MYIFVPMVKAVALARVIPGRLAFCDHCANSEQDIKKQNKNA